MSDDKAIAVKVLSKTVWSDTLFSFTTTRPDGLRFEAGQFVRLGVKPSELAFYQDSHEHTSHATPHYLQDKKTEMPILSECVFRAYSLVSSPYDECLEFFSVVVPDGAFTSQLQHLQVGDILYLNPQVFGFLTLSRYQEPAPQDLWLLATGTGVAPFLSILQDLHSWQNYQNIVLTYSVRTASELAYFDKIMALADSFGSLVDGPAKFRFIPIITRDEGAKAGGFADLPCLNARLPALIATGELETAANLSLNADTSHVMLCGNPQMVEDTKEALKQKGLTMNRRGVGNIAVENYW